MGSGDVALILEYRTLTKLTSTYCQGLKKAIAADGRIHTRFRQTETRTGRISSVEPNLQNIPVRTELGSELRKFFRAGEGMTLVDADYSQIELRVLAHMAGDRTMTDAFRNGEDIHAVTASQVFGVPLAEVTSRMRSNAKAVNFGGVIGLHARETEHDELGFQRAFDLRRRFFGRCGVEAVEGVLRVLAACADAHDDAPLGGHGFARHAARPLGNSDIQAGGIRGEDADVIVFPPEKGDHLLKPRLDAGQIIGKSGFHRFSFLQRFLCFKKFF